uniref:Clp R domain-containing protein n=1 Tax=Rhizophora mucronata TaxID=61149 RepID=A0A2P2L0H5_RHIMU
MPTPVSVARQCLTDEAVRVLDDAVAVARRRSHVQTTSLHAVSALLALPSSTLRDACARSRRSSYSPRLQFRVLDLSVGVALDRLPSSKSTEEPPISNSLMAAIKRSQANQRRHPDSFHLQQICNQQTASSALKVALRYLILSILDDPVVSRVFGEAGFRSCDIKLAIIHNPNAKFSRNRCPPIFLCNLAGSSESGRPGLSFPFGRYDDEDENCRRIGGVLVKRNGKSKNLLLLGVCAGDALRMFIEYVNRDKCKESVLPGEIAGFRAISIEKEILEFVSEGSIDRAKMGPLFEMVGHKLERFSGSGIVVSFGELNVLVSESVSSDSVSHVVTKLTGLLESFGEKLWLMGAAASYEMYCKFLEKFPSLEEDWDLQLLPISTSKSSADHFGSKSSLMGSFIPFGGFFSTPSDFRNPLSGINQLITQCHHCNVEYEQEAAANLKVGSAVSVADQHSKKLPSWLQMAELDNSKGVDVAKTADDGAALNTRILGVQRKWNDNCQHLHQAQPFSNFDISQARSQVAIADGFLHVADRKESSSGSSSSKEPSLNDSQLADMSFGVNKAMQKTLSMKTSIPIAVTSKADNIGCQSKPQEKVPQGCNPYPLLHPSRPNDHISSLSVGSVTTDLSLGTLYASTSREPYTSKLCGHQEHLLHFSGSHSAELDIVGEGTSWQIALSSSCSGLSSGGQLDLSYYKSVRRSLFEKVCWQDGAICTIAEAVSHWKAGCGRRCDSNRRDFWLTFLGYDRVGKKRIASALAEIMFGCQDCIFSVDLKTHDRISSSNSMFDHQDLTDYDTKFRGKTVVDYIVLELSKKPQSIVFLENVDKADLQTQTSLSQAIRSGKFPDSHGREIRTNNRIFVTTTTIEIDKKFHYLEQEPVDYCEGNILRAKSWQMQIKVEHLSGSMSRSNKMNVRVSRKASSTSCANKRKVNRNCDSTGDEISFEAKKRVHKAFRSHLDLNLPIEEAGEDVSSLSNSESISENSEAWLEDFLSQVDEKVIFKPFDFDALADNILKEINTQFQSAFGFDAVLEIDHEVMIQILAASWLSERKSVVEDWVQNVLSIGFTEAQQKYNVTAGSFVKLISCEGLLMEDQAPGVLLPSRIYM